MKKFYQAFVCLFLIFCSAPAISEQRFLLVAHGPFDYKLTKECSEGRVVIALDGAAADLYKFELPVDYILGDFDSIEELSKKGILIFDAKGALEYFKTIQVADDSILTFEPYRAEQNRGKRDVTFVRAKSQNYTDLEKGILFCLSKRADTNEKIDIQIVCALGGERSDHTVTNLFFLKKYNKEKYPNLTLSLLNAEETIRFLKDETITVPSAVGGKFGLFGFPVAYADCKELAWPLDNMRLEMGVMESACNEVINSSLTVTVRGEALMIGPRPRKKI
ncbi:MAG: thiamine pyrophosphokinase [Alphaproteobacteria bacterium]|nr:thiamine pyrophosphokinase [Alphaproteobacteria bacterium]